MAHTDSVRPPVYGHNFEKDLVALRPRLVGYCASLLGKKNVHQAEDLAQQAIQRALVYKDQFAPGTNLKAWVFMIARNRFFTENRRAWREGEWDGALFERTLTAGYRIEQQEARTNLSMVLKAMEKLPKDMSDSLKLYVEGNSYEEIAEILDCAIGTAKSRVARARAYLKAYTKWDNDS